MEIIMLKQVLLASSMFIAGPVLAQTTGAPAQTAPAANTPRAQSQPAPSATAPTVPQAPTGDVPSAQTSPDTPTPTTPADPVTTQQTPASPVEPGTAVQAPAPTSPQAATTPPAPQGSTAPQGEVAQIIDREFGAYDKDRDGRLSQVEFAAWMVALKTASDPATQADSAETKRWLGAAFAQADADKNRGVTKVELTGFLSQGQS
jgi:hypothetical protein